MRYEYMSEPVDKGSKLVDVCNKHAKAGWRVHTVVRSDANAMYRVLFERDADDPVKPNLFKELP